MPERPAARHALDAHLAPCAVWQAAAAPGAKCLSAIKGIDFDEKLTFDTSLMYTAVAEGQVDVISAYTTDGRVAEFDLLLLEDPLNALPPYDGFLAVSEEAMNNPLFVETLSALENKITSDVMREANRLVDVEGKSVTEAVAYIRDVISSL